MPVTVANPGDDENDKRLDRISNRFSKFRRHAKTDGSPEATQMRLNRAVNRKIASATGQSGASNLSFATGRPRDPLFYWRENNLPYDFYKEGEDILRRAAGKNRALDMALATWGDITFNYESTDTPDAVVTPTA